MRMTSKRFHSLFGASPRSPEAPIRELDMDLAASIQAVTEEIMLRCARHVYTETGMKKLCLAGGVALNAVANGRLAREGPFDDIWIQPAAGDAGGALGTALFIWHQLLDKPRTVDSLSAQRGSLLGPRFALEAICSYLDGIGAIYQRFDNDDELCDFVARQIAEQKVVGWMQGRMEFGPRALGARSIIGDARSPAMQQTMNLKIKYRESFRPFAPCVLREFAHEYFELRESEESPYMLMVAPVLEKRRVKLHAAEREKMKDPDLRVRVSVPRSTVPAITHVDYSARVQTVDEERHGRFYRLMRRFYDLTGCPVIVNTSFNIRGEPILCTPEQAYRCFMATDIDCLVLENCLLIKDLQPAGLLEDAEAYKAQYALD
jgi:carbamoyltransferase